MQVFCPTRQRRTGGHDQLGSPRLLQSSEPFLPFGLACEFDPVIRELQPSIPIRRIDRPGRHLAAFLGFLPEPFCVGLGHCGQQCARNASQGTSPIVGGAASCPLCVSQPFDLNQKTKPAAGHSPRGLNELVSLMPVCRCWPVAPSVRNDGVLSLASIETGSRDCRMEFDTSGSLCRLPADRLQPSPAPAALCLSLAREALRVVDIRSELSVAADAMANDGARRRRRTQVTAAIEAESRRELPFRNGVGRPCTGQCQIPCWCAPMPLCVRPDGFGSNRCAWPRTRGPFAGMQE